MSRSDKLFSFLLGSEVMCFRGWLKSKKRKFVVLPKKIDTLAFGHLFSDIVANGRIEYVPEVQASCWFPPPGAIVYFLFYRGVDSQYYMVRFRNGKQMFIYLSTVTVREITAQGLPEALWHKFRKNLAEAPLGIPICVEGQE